MRSLWPDIADNMAKPLAPDVVRAVCLGDGGITFAPMPVDRGKADHAATVQGTPGPSLKEVVEGIIEKERRLCLTVLRETRPALAARTVVTEMNTRTEAFVEELRRSGADKTACREGCSWCCRGLDVEVTPAEAIAIAEYLTDNLDSGGLTVVRDRITKDAIDIRSRSTEQRRVSRVACPLLDEAKGRCVAYEARPGVCRSYNSMDADACERAFDANDDHAPIPHNGVMRAGPVAALMGFAQACKAHGVDPRGDLRLSLALDVAFVPQSAERWARGEWVFDAAALSPAERLASADVPRATTPEDEHRRERNARKRERKKGRR